MSGHVQSRDLKPPNHLSILARDSIPVLVLGIILICVHELSTPFERGFHCDDLTIRYPYKESTVPSSLCYSIGSGLNVLLIILLEYKLILDESKKQRLQPSSCRFPVKLYVRNVCSHIIVWLFGAISSELLTDISKFTAGRLRPHFIDVCKPKIRMGQSNPGVDLEVYCQDSAHRLEYITDYYCDGNPKALRDTRLSFMSGHSSYSAYSAAFAVFYIQSAMDINTFGMVKPAFQVLITSVAFYTGLTRVSDYKHHWQDVLAGLAQGTLVASVAALKLWPQVHQGYLRIFKGAREVDNQAGEELNRVSY